MVVLQLWRERLVALKDREAGNPTGNLQMASDGAGADSLCRALVSSVLAVVAGRGGTAGGTRSGDRSYYRVALGTVLCARTPAPGAGSSQADQQVLACR